MRRSSHTEWWLVHSYYFQFNCWLIKILLRDWQSKYHFRKILWFPLCALESALFAVYARLPDLFTESSSSYFTALTTAIINLRKCEYYSLTSVTMTLRCFISSGRLSEYVTYRLKILPLWMPIYVFSSIFLHIDALIAKTNNFLLAARSFTYYIPLSTPVSRWFILSISWIRTTRNTSLYNMPL